MRRHSWREKGLYGRDIQQACELRVRRRVVNLVRQRPQPGGGSRSQVVLARVDDHCGEPVFPTGSSWCDQATEGPADQRDARGVNLGIGCDGVEHARHDVLPVGTHWNPPVVKHRPLARAVQGSEGVATLDRGGHRGVQFLSRPVVPADVQDGRHRPVAWPGRNR
jgi:hypothetical protein